jgi:hypothetical protein
MDLVLGWEGWRQVTIAACVVLALGCLVFVVGYQRAVGWSWWHNPFGRFMMTRKLVLLALAALILSNRVVGPWAGREAATAFLMWIFALQTFIPYRLLLAVRRDTRTNPNLLEAASERSEDSRP